MNSISFDKEHYPVIEDTFALYIECKLNRVIMVTDSIRSRMTPETCRKLGKQLIESAEVLEKLNEQE